MQKKWLIDRRTCLRGLGASLALPLLETMGWAEKIGGNGLQTSGAARVHVHAARGYSGSVLADESGKLFVFAPILFGIPEACAGSMPDDEGYFGNSDYSIEWRSTRARIIHVADSDPSRPLTAQSD